jgi:hypothetical protein
MNAPTLSRLGAACGAAFSIVLFVAVGDGTQPYSNVRAVAGTAAIALAIPFIAYVYSLIRAAEGPDGWLAPAALVAGVAGIVLKLGSGAPELALHRANVGTGTSVYAAVNQLGDAETLLALFPLAIFCAAVAIVALRTRTLPRWLGVFAAVAAVALAVNGGLPTTESVPGFLLFLLWSLVASGYLMVRGRRAAVRSAEVAVEA